MIKAKKVEDLEIEIYLPDSGEEPFKSIKAQKSEKVWQGELEREDGTPLYVRHRAILSFVGMRIKADGSIRVFANFDGEKLRIGGLRVKSAPDVELEAK
ncbi:MULTISPECIES: hypothetical protein [Methylobacterium]|uniref:hypothetical protein n=1 Tax=Methylobacterium TaxID=407 RepID=UPI0013EB3D92|nr:hypothetical protein [Methylobacterium sp. DB0501]NGM39040.1 hypothetical protein [Methylobacterium sp. DB0501]